MVTWGTNTVSFFNQNNGNTGSSTSNTPATATSSSSNTASAPSLFGTPSANKTATSSSSSAFSFGSSTFGNPSTPAPPSTPGFSAFSSQPTPVQSPAFGLFSPSSAPGGSTSTTFSQNPSNVGAATTAQSGTFTQFLGAPQQAALQAHMNAAAQQESTSLELQLLQLHAALSPLPAQIPPTSASNMMACRFQHIFYDPITQAQRLEKLSLPSYPPKPQHLPEDVWHRAMANNPDPEEYIPVLVTSAEGLHSRLVAQQSKMELHEGYLNKIENTLRNRADTNRSVAMQLKHYQRQNALIRSRLMQIMLKFELCRGKNVPLQQGEQEAVRKLIELSRQIHKVATVLELLQREEEEFSKQWNAMKVKQERIRMRMGPTEVLAHGVMMEAIGILNGQKKGIDEISRVVQKNARDLKIMKQDGR
jgi:hypothetical protein